MTRTGGTWPFHSWNRAEALTFNQFRARPLEQIVVYNDDGWAPHVADRKAIDAAQAQKAVDLVKRTSGGVEVSKCSFPRHAVVLYDGDVPVASINVCFECGDIELWPRWEPRPDYDKLTSAQHKALLIRHEQQLKVYRAVFPSWQTFFRDEIGYPIAASYDH